MNRSTWFLALGTALVLNACSASVTDSARNGFPGKAGGPLVDCDEVLPVFSPDTLVGAGYFFGDIVKMEPILDGVRQNTHQTGVYLSDTYACSDYGLAALRMTFNNVQASWDSGLRELEVLVRAEGLSSLDTSPVIDPKTHDLMWATREGTRAMFPGRGTRLGMPIRGSEGGAYIGAFVNVSKVGSKGEIELHYQDDCQSYRASDFPTESSVLTHVRGLEGASEIDFSQDLSWYVTSICEYP